MVVASLAVSLVGFRSGFGPGGLGMIVTLATLVKFLGNDPPPRIGVTLMVIVALLVGAMTLARLQVTVWPTVLHANVPLLTLLMVRLASIESVTWIAAPPGVVAVPTF